MYQIAKRALFNNTLVVIPTGMGKTFIASVVMYNYHRWYTNGIIIFAAPTRALVNQQMISCYNYLDIAQEEYCDLTGKTSPDKRPAK